MKTFAELCLDRFWSSYVLKWKEALQISPQAKAKGFISEVEIEHAIAAFVYAVAEEHKLTGLKRFGFGLLDPTQVTFDGKKWYDLPPPKSLPH